MNGKQRQEWYQLFGAICDGTISDSQHERLQDILSEDSDARQLYFQYLDVHLALSPGETEESCDLFPLTIDHESSCKTGVSQSEGLESKTALPIRRYAAFLAALAVVLIVAAGLVLRPSDNLSTITNHLPVSKQKHLATVRQTSQVRFAEGSPALQVGSVPELHKQYVMTEGKLELLFESGAEVILEGPSVFELTAGETLTVDYGNCSVHAPEGAEGFVVKTPLSQVVDLGTRFSVSIGESGETEVQVIEGEAEVHPATDSNSDPISKSKEVTRLKRGMAKKYVHDHQMIEKNIPFDRSRYSSRLPDRIIKYRATPGLYGGVENLESVTVQRGGRQIEYQVDQLIGIEVIHFKGVPKGTGYLTTGLDDSPESLPGLFGRGLLDADRSPTTGLINLGGNVQPLVSDAVFHSPEMEGKPNTPGMAIRFQSPVVNSPGPDIVLFDLHVIVHPVHGDQFHVSPLPFKPGLHSHTIRNFDINLSSAEALMIDQFKLYVFKSPVNSLDQLQTIGHNGGTLHTVRAKALATGIDLSDLGYREGEKVSALFLQDAMGKGGHLDPVFIAGFPPLNEIPPLD